MAAVKARAIVFWILALILAVGLIFGLPPLVKYQLEKSLSEYLLQAVSIETLSLNPFRGTVKIEGLKIGTRTASQNAVINIELWLLTKRHIHVQSLLVSDVQLPIQSDNSALSVADFSILSTKPGSDSSPTEAWRVSVDTLQLERIDLDVSYDGSSHKVVLQSLVVGAFDTAGTTHTPLSAVLSVNDAPINFDGAFLIQSKAQQFSGELDVKGLGLKDFSAVLGDVAGHLDLKKSIQVTRNELEIVAKASGELGLIGADGFDFRASNMAWTGTVQYKGESLALNGDLKVSDVETPYGQVGSAEWSGDLSYESADEFSLEGSARFIDLRPLDMGAIGELDASAIKLSATSLSMARLAVLKANLRVERLVNGEFAFAGRLPNPTAIETPAVDAAAQFQTQTKTSEAASLSIDVQEIEVKDSKLEFADSSVEPLVDLELNNIAARVEKFSLRDSFSIDFLGHHQIEPGLEAQLKVNGEVNIASMTGAIKMKISNFELHEIAPYLGNGIRSGRLQLGSDLKMTNGRLAVKNEIHIKNVKIDESAQNVGDQMSLATALFLLKDKNDVVDLDVPFETDFDKFEIDFGDMFQSALLRAAKTTAVTYAQYALQPYGSLLLAKDLLGAITRPRFEAVIFSEGSGELTAKTQGYIEKLAALLVTKSELSVTVCGFADMSELPRLLEMEKQGEKGEDASLGSISAEGILVGDVTRIKMLAQIRSRAVLEVLQAGGIKSARIYACTATAESKGGQPRVEIVL
jgi:outer membrane protein OmpA-like peptidoglycan-associated protein